MRNLLQENRRGRVVRTNGNGVVEICIIEPGQGSSGYYTPEVLKLAVQERKFDNVPIMKNHPGAGNRTDREDIDMSVGWIRPGTVRYVSGRQPGVYGEAKILKPYRELLSSLADPECPFGLSIHATGDLENEFDKTTPVKYIEKVRSVDIVVSPGAGGSITDVIESKKRDQGDLHFELLEEDNVAIKFHTLMESADGGPAVPVFMDTDNGNLFEFAGNIGEEDEIDESKVGDAFRSGRERITRTVASGRDRVVSAAKSSGGRIRAGAEAAGRGARRGAGHVRANPKRYAIGAGAGIGLTAAGAGAGHLMNRREEEIDEEEFYEENIMEDEYGNQYLFLGNALEEDDAELMEAPRFRPKGAKLRKSFGKEDRMTGAQWRERYVKQATPGSTRPEKTPLGPVQGPTRPGMQGVGDRVRMDPMYARAGRGYDAAKAHVSANRNRYIGAGLAAGGLAAAGGGYAATRNRKEEMPIWEDENGAQFVYLEDLQEDYDGYDERDAMLEEVNAKLDMLLDGGQTEELIMEEANRNTVGSNKSRRLIEEAARMFASNPRDAMVLGGIMGQAIQEDRAARADDWSMQTAPVGSWDNMIGQGSAPMGYFGSEGGNLLEESNQGNGDALAQALFQADSSMFNRAYLG